MLSGLFGRGADVEVRQSSFFTETAWDSGGTSGYMGASSATQLLAVYGSVRFIADQISTLPLDVYRRLPDGSRQSMPTPGWLDEPTVDLSWPDWCGQVLWSLLLHGNAYITVTRNDRAGIAELQPLDPGEVTPFRRRGGMTEYYLSGRPFSGELVHIKGLMKPGDIVGVSPLEAARQSIGLGLSALEYGSGLFDRDANMPGVIELPGRLQPDAVGAMAKAWARNRSRRNRGMPGVLVEGATWKPTGVTPEQGQFLETRQWTAAEIAAQVFLVDPVELGIPVTGTSLEYKNQQDRDRRKVQTTFLPWIVRIERAVSALLVEPRYVKLNVDALLRGSIADRFAVYKTASDINTAAAGVGQAPVLTTNEMREYEDLVPLPDPVQVERDGTRKLSVAEAVQKVYLGVGSVVTSDEAREIVNDAGGNLKVPGPPLAPASK